MKKFIKNTANSIRTKARLLLIGHHCSLGLCTEYTVSLIIENIHIHQHLLKITNSFSAGSTHECALREKALAPDLSAFHAGALPLAS